MLAIPTDIELVDCAAASYAADAKPYVEAIASAIRVFLTTRADGFNIIAVEGTHDLLGWDLDFFALKAVDRESAHHPSLGFVHAGFYAAAQAVIAKISLLAFHGSYALTGHSLGGAMALLLGGLLIDDGYPPTKIGAFAPPMVGGDQFVKVVTSVPLFACRYGMDIVPTVPFPLPGFPYRQVPMTEFQAPRMDDIFAYHSIGNYVTAVHAMGETT